MSSTSVEKSCGGGDVVGAFLWVEYFFHIHVNLSNVSNGGFQLWLCIWASGGVFVILYGGCGDDVFILEDSARLHWWYCPVWIATVGCNLVIWIKAYGKELITLSTVYNQHVLYYHFTFVSLLFSLISKKVIGPLRLGENILIEEELGDGRIWIEVFEVYEGFLDFFEQLWSTS